MQAEELNPIADKLNKANSILILTPPQASGDDLSAALALRTFLRKLEKEVVLISPGPPNAKFDFLTGFEEVKDHLSIAKSFVIDLSTKASEIDELGYKKEPERLSIYVKPKKGQFSDKDVSFRSSNFPFDLIVSIGVFSLENLGEFYIQNSDLFFETPIINIDRSAQNESYGSYNLIDLSATSNSEIMLDLISVFESSLLDQSIATALLTGIIAETNSFQHVRTTPAAFLKASNLISLGADQPQIMSRLYKSKSMGFLKLWGRVLARLKQDPQLSLVYSMIVASDVDKAEATAEDVGMVIKEMTLQLSFAKTFFFMVERGDKVEIFGQTISPVNLPQAFLEYKPQIQGSAIRFESFQNLNQTESLVLSKLREAIS